MTRVHHKHFPANRCVARSLTVSARWATVYNVISPAAKVIGNAATVASIASNIVDLAPQFEKVYQSNASGRDKAQKYSLLTSIVAQKTLAGIVTGGVHLIYLPIILGCGAAARAGGGGSITLAANVCSEAIKNADTLVHTSATYVTDPATQQKILQNVVNIFIH